MKIAVVGLTWPFRGGISHYTTLLCLNLEKKHKVRLFSFSTQYPRFLFPGKTQYDHESKLRYDAERILSTINPISWIKTLINVLKFKPDLVLFEYWNPILAPSYFVISLGLKLFRKKMLYECHNVLPHESTILDKLLLRMAFANCNKFIVHSEEDFRNLRKKNKIKVPHPIYSVFKKNISKTAAKKKLGVNGNVILFFGLVREYKGLKYLLKAMPGILKKKKITLIIAGEFYDNYEKYRDLIKKIGKNVLIVNRYIPNEEISTYFQASDLVVLPYVTATQSGIVQIAYAHDKPVITTNVGGLPEVVDDEKTGYLVNPENHIEIAKAVIRFYESKVNFQKNIRDYKKRFGWASLVKKIENN